MVWYKIGIINDKVLLYTNSSVEDRAFARNMSTTT